MEIIPIIQRLSYIYIEITFLLYRHQTDQYKQCKGFIWS